MAGPEQPLARLLKAEPLRAQAWSTVFAAREEALALRAPLALPSEGSQKQVHRWVTKKKLRRLRAPPLLFRVPVTTGFRFFCCCCCFVCWPVGVWLELVCAGGIIGFVRQLNV